MKLRLFFAFILWSVAMFFCGAWWNAVTNPPSPIKYRVETQPREPTIQECRDFIKRKWKGALLQRNLEVRD